MTNEERDRARTAANAAQAEAERSKALLRAGARSAAELALLDALDNTANALEALGYRVHVTIERPEP